jgi:hypothetical protein
MKGTRKGIWGRGMKEGRKIPRKKGSKTQE